MSGAEIALPGSFDSHAHIGAPELLPEAAALLDRGRASGVEGVLAVGAGYGIEANAGAVALADEHRDVWASVGVHPHDASLWNSRAERAIEGFETLRPVGLDLPPRRVVQLPDQFGPGGNLLAGPHRPDLGILTRSRPHDRPESPGLA